MKLIIDIPDEIRLALINNIQLSQDQKGISDAYIDRAIINGIPLSKHHGIIFLELHLLDDNKKIMLNINCINSIYQTNEKTTIYVGKVIYQVKENYEQIKELITTMQDVLDLPPVTPQLNKKVEGGEGIWLNTKNVQDSES